MSERVQRVGQMIALGAVAVLLALLVWRVAAGPEGGAADKLARGEKVSAPDFTLDRLDGDGTLTFADLRGKAVVVNFWASWCLPCKDEAPMLEETYKRYKEEGLVVLGIDAQDFKQDAKGFIRRFELTYPTVFDGKGSTLGKWGVKGFPETFFVDRNGNLVGERISGAVDIERNREAFDAGVQLALGNER